jgi:hypothetical protein
MTPKQIIHNAIKRHAGLSDWDDKGIAYEVEAILRALARKGFKFERSNIGERK